MGRAGRLVTVACVLGVSVLAACGGGGGTTPPVGPSTNPGPSSHPSGSPSPSPAPTFSTTPTPGPSPTNGQTPTPLPSPTTPPPTAIPPPTPTPSPKPTATPTSVPSATPTPNQQLVYSVGSGQINGDDTVFTGSPSAREKNDGDYPSGGHGPVNTSMTGPDGNTVSCLSSMAENYHVHAFLGFYNSGHAVALSDGIGMAEPQGDGDYAVNGTTIHNWENYATQCFYEMHTHDASGVIHIEAPSPNCGGATQNTVPCDMSIFTLGDFLAVWGVQIMPTGIYSNGAPIMSGSVQIYTSGPVARGGPNHSAEVGSNTYSLYTGDPNAIPLYSHEVIFVDVGSGNLTGSALPNVAFYETW